ncbi:GNAT family N-acetyltransferase [Roseomonas genomospecies 6]|uniref:GNAT family N-acetyltransferase n=1 Tax=Roseomonas genomospecies 6 TaxID=214106 RepID=A0A9W7NME5_9PROT|nr:GNAT family N-acetyltransferase [Roseomonas genomospecies 6]KAA0682913.1 GNAT family N-acetyltransferase [Roseomonas genomospecies 6]
MTAALSVPSRPVRLQTAGLADVPVVAALQQGCFPEDPWGTGSIASLMGQPGFFSVLALREGGDDDPVGFLLARVAADDGEIIAVGVRPDARGLGVGRRLVAAALDGARALGATALFLEVAEDNDAAQSLYKSCGFLPVGRRPGYYRRADGRVAALVLRYSYTDE